MRALIVSLFGNYTPVTYTNVDSIDIIPDGMAGIDWPWLSGVLLFAITLYCVFRVLGAIFKK